MSKPRVAEAIRTAIEEAQARGELQSVTLPAIESVGEPWPDVPRNGVTVRGPFWTLWREGKWAGVQVRLSRWFVTIDRRSLHRPYFSERYGHDRWYYIGPLVLKAGKLRVIPPAR